MTALAGRAVSTAGAGESGIRCGAAAQYCPGVGSAPHALESWQSSRGRLIRQNHGRAGRSDIEIGAAIPGHVRSAGLPRRLRLRPRGLKHG